MSLPEGCRRPSTGTPQPRRNIGRRATKLRRFGLFPFRSPLLRESRLISLPRGTEMFQFPQFPSPTYGFSRRCVGIPPRGFPHSGIPGSQPAGGSPGLIAASHALLRPLVPRHPPCALSSFIHTRHRHRDSFDRLPFSTLPVQLLRYHPVGRLQVKGYKLQVTD